MAPRAQSCLRWGRSRPNRTWRRPPRVRRHNPSSRANLADGSSRVDAESRTAFTGFGISQGRDELKAGEMWNSNSMISWLIARTGLDVDSIKPPAGGVPLAGTLVSWLRLENRRWLLVRHYDRRHKNTCGSESRAEVPAAANQCTCTPNIPKGTSQQATRFATWWLGCPTGSLCRLLSPLASRARSPSA